MEHILRTIKKCVIEISEQYKQTVNLGQEISTTNSSGDSQKKLDVIADDILTQRLLREPAVRAIASEEREQILWSNTDACYLVVFDPLDGSKNIELNLMTGTIFGIFEFGDNKIEGKNLLASGYALYGPTTQLVIAQEKVELFQLKENNFIKIKELTKQIGKNYHINSSKRLLWDDKTKELINELNMNNYNSRWNGCMVADVHNIILKGGYFLYPSNSKDTKGKIRLLYEAMPMAFIAHKLDGISTDCNEKNILSYNLDNNNLHQKIPIKIYLG